MHSEDMSQAELLRELQRLREELQVRRVESAQNGTTAQALGNLLRLMCDNVPDMIWAKDIDRNYLFANKAICEKLLNARNTDEPLGRNDLFFALRERASHPEDPDWHTFGEICLDSDGIVLESRKAERFDEYGNVRGKFLFLDVHKAPFFDDAGNLIGTVGCARDVTWERGIEETLRRSETRFKTIFNNTDISIWEEDFSEAKAALDRLVASGIGDLRAHLQDHPEFVLEVARTIRVLDVNNATLAFYGAESKEQLLGSLDPVLLPETLPMLQEFLLAISEGRPRFEYETVNRTLDGKVLNVLIRLFLPREEQEYRSLLLCILDITAKKQLEAERRRTQKLESLGVLAGGIAHDFNNLLMGITGSISLARLHMEGCAQAKGSRPLNALENAEKACERARTLTHQLLTFSRGGNPVKKPLEVRELLTSAVNFSLSGSNVRCIFSIPKDVWNIEADENQFTQVISNLVLNGIEAMPDGGTLHVRARNRNLEAQEVPQLAAGRAVEITIQDQGVGIPEEHLQRVFDPYFTAKKGGRGLGLAIVYSVVLRHGGHVRLDSELGMGTTVTIFLPATDAQPASLEAAPEDTVAKACSVLIMDDEEIVRAAVSAMLEFLGCQVETATDGAEMLALYRQAMDQGGRFDLVIMDLTIPGGMGGVEAVRELLRIDPEAKALVSSGYSNDPVMANYKAYGFAGVVPKPYRIGELNRALASILTGASDEA